ncbi:MAG: hypothetical protein HY602_01225 [Parcubacteria group bacterium]|nr:hypothetical protein [Parcubacteria group bacterium]
MVEEGSSFIDSVFNNSSPIYRALRCGLRKLLSDERIASEEDLKNYLRDGDIQEAEQFLRDIEESSKSETCEEDGDCLIERLGHFALFLFHRGLELKDLPDGALQRLGASIKFYYLGFAKLYLQWLTAGPDTSVNTPLELQELMDRASTMVRTILACVEFSGGVLSDIGVTLEDLHKLEAEYQQKAQCCLVKT